MLIKIEKEGRTAQCERFQLEAMEAKGWRVAPPPKVDAKGNPIEVEPAPGLFQVYKGDKTGWSDEKTWKVLEKEGWEKGQPEASEVDHAPQSTELAEILAGLDPADDEFWTQAGTLRIETFNATFDRSETRASIDTAWPGFSREVLIEG